MNMKNKLKIISIILILVIICSNNLVQAFGIDDLNPIEPSGESVTDMKNFTNDILGVIEVVGIVLSIIILIILGIKYMIGSTEEKAEYKKTLMPYVIGALVLFTGSIIPNIIYKIVSNL